MQQNALEKCALRNLVFKWTTRNDLYAFKFETILHTCQTAKPFCFRSEKCIVCIFTPSKSHYRAKRKYEVCSFAPEKSQFKHGPAYFPLCFFGTSKNIHKTRQSTICACQLRYSNQKICMFQFKKHRTNMQFCTVQFQTQNIAERQCKNTFSKFPPASF